MRTKEKKGEVIGYASVKLSKQWGIETCCLNLKKSGVGVAQNRHRCICGTENKAAKEQRRKAPWKLVELRLVS